MAQPGEPGVLQRLFDSTLLADILTKRLPVWALVFVIEAVLFFLIANLPFLPGEQTRYLQSVNSSRAAFQAQPIPMQIVTIFWNNEQIAIQDLSPLTGPFELILTGYATARTIEAIALQASATPNSELFTLYLVPDTWIELSAYALATTEAVYIIAAVLRGGFDWNRLERELRYVPTVVVMIVLILAVAAIFEVLTIHVGGYDDLLFWIPTFLGVFLLAITVIRRPASSPAESAGLSGAPVASPSGVEGIRRDVESRVRTDRPTSTAWLVLPALELLLEYSVLLLVIYSLFLEITDALHGSLPSQVPLLPFGQPYYTLVTYLAFAGLMAFLYHLIRRRNEHFGREHAFLEDLLGELEARAAAQPDRLDEFRARLVPARKTLDEIRIKEARRDPLVWTVSTFFVGILILFVYYFLMKDFYRHEQREDLFLQQLSFAASAIGVSLQPPGRDRPLTNRSFVLSAVLSLVTFLAYWMYWNYRMIQDQNQHLVSEWELEDNLLTTMGGNLASG